MRPRLAEELALVREVYGAVEHLEVDGEDWFKLPAYKMPPGWQIGAQTVAEVPICFLVKGDYPGASPYGFLTPQGLNFKGQAPKNTSAPPKPVPFEGDWLHFSWTAENWAAANEVRRGSNLLDWCRGFTERFKEGA